MKKVSRKKIMEALSYWRGMLKEAEAPAGGIKAREIDLSEAFGDDGWEFACPAAKGSLEGDLYAGRSGLYRLDPSEVARILAAVQADGGTPSQYWLLGNVPEMPLSTPDELAKYYGYDQPPPEGEDEEPAEKLYHENPEKFLADAVEDELWRVTPDRALGAREGFEPFLAKAKWKKGVDEWVDWPVACCLVKLF